MMIKALVGTTSTMNWIISFENTIHSKATGLSNSHDRRGQKVREDAERI